jgi:hypothetical protein
MRERHKDKDTGIEPPPPQKDVVATTAVFKGTTLPHIVVKRAAQLFPSGFSTYQPDKSASGAKFWAFHRRCALDPPEAGLIKVHERHVRKAGPLRAVASYARDKNVLKLVRAVAQPHPLWHLRTCGDRLRACSRLSIDMRAPCMAAAAAAGRRRAARARLASVRAPSVRRGSICSAARSHPRPLCSLAPHPPVLLPDRMARQARAQPWDHSGAWV